MKRSNWLGRTRSWASLATSGGDVVAVALFACRESRRIAVVVLMAVLALTGPAWGQGSSSRGHDPLQERIRSARTAADHEALAREYERLAALAEADAKLHERRGAAYDDSSLPGVMQAHCAEVAAAYRQAASRFAALAEEHRKLARRANGVPE